MVGMVLVVDDVRFDFLLDFLLMIYFANIKNIAISVIVV
jgi:hypothetical protein